MDMTMGHECPAALLDNVRGGLGNRPYAKIGKDKILNPKC